MFEPVPYMYIYIHHAIINKVNIQAALHVVCQTFNISYAIKVHTYATKIFIVKANSKIEIEAAAK